MSKNKILMLSIFALILLSVVFTFVRMFITQNYIIEAQIECDPKVESCFVWFCDPEEGECEEPNEPYFYKLIIKKAVNFDVCDLRDEDCEEPRCEKGELDCEVINCIPEEMEDGEVCSDEFGYEMETEEEGDSEE